MDKEKYYEYRTIEEEIRKAYFLIKVLDQFLKRKGGYISCLTDEKREEAIKIIEKYQKLVDYEANMRKEEVNMLLEKYSKGCEHEIIFQGVNDDTEEPTGDYYCPLCRHRLFSDKTILNNRIIIDVPAIYLHETPYNNGYLYLAIDYMIRNDLEWTQDNFDLAIKESVPDKGLYKALCRVGYIGMYKVRSKK